MSLPDSYIGPPPEAPMVYRCRHCGNDICDGEVYAPNDGDPICEACADQIKHVLLLRRASAEEAEKEARDRATDLERRRRNEN